VLEKIIYSTNYQLLKEVDLVIENVTEKREIKKEVYQKREKISSPYCVVLANTPCIPITEITSYTTRPDKIIGTHFMNPVPSKSTVEVIRGYHLKISL
jgi:3-hydroxybutyryl-CoA dehydrogenase